jgi:hypothetical protein
MKDHDWTVDIHSVIGGVYVCKGCGSKVFGVEPIPIGGPYHSNGIMDSVRGWRWKKPTFERIFRLDIDEDCEEQYVKSLLFDVLDS